MVTIDNTGEGEHNWLSSLGARLKDMGYDLDVEIDMDSVVEAADTSVPVSGTEVTVQEPEETYEYPIPAPREFAPPRYEPNISAADRDMPKTTCHTAAKIMGADFQVDYAEGGFRSKKTGELVTPRYERGEKTGKPQFQFIYRTDTEQALGVVSGNYPERDGYRHVLDTMEGMFPNTCTGITTYGAGEKAVISQELGEPIDLGGGDLIQPFLYTRMSLNRTWATSAIPKMSRISCENMLGTSGAVITVRATKNHDARLTLEAEIMQASLNQAEAMRRMAYVMKNQDFTDAQFMDMVRTLIPVPESDHQTALTRRNNKVAACSQAWMDECGSGDGTRHTGDLWLAYNAVQGAEQHVINSPNTLIDENGEKYRDQGKGLAKTLDGKTPLADACEQYLIDLMGGNDRYTQLTQAV